MPPKRSARGGRAPVSNASRTKTNDKKQAPLKPKDSGVKKSQGQRQRPVQPRIAKALRNAVDQVSPELRTDLPDLPSVPPHEFDAPKVTRISNPIFQSTPASLYFVIHCRLNTTADAETIALNLLDHFMQPHHVLPQLWYGRLHAVSFLLACRLTRIENSIEAVAKAVEAQTCGLAATGSFWGGALTVPVDDVKAGLKAVLARRDDIMALVGDYAEALETMTLEGDDSVEAPAHVELPNQADVGEAIDLEAELFDFDTYQDPEEGPC